MNKYAHQAIIGSAIVVFSGVLWAGQLSIVSISASSEQSGNYATNIIDGDQSTRWAAADSTYPQSVTLDLGSAQKIDSAVIAFYNPTTRVYTYSLLKSTNNTLYDTIVRAVQSNTNSTITHILGVTARYLMLVFTNVTDISTGWLPWAGLYEITLYGGSTVSVIRNTGSGVTGPLQMLTIRSIDNRTLLISADGASYDLGVYTINGQCITRIQGSEAKRVRLSSPGLHNYYISGKVNGRQVNQRIPLK